MRARTRASSPRVHETSSSRTLLGMSGAKHRIGEQQLRDRERVAVSRHAILREISRSRHEQTFELRSPRPELAFHFRCLLTRDVAVDLELLAVATACKPQRGCGARA